MPVAVKAFACHWGCRRKVTTHRDDMARHEERCRRNPTSRACPTCEHNSWESADYDVGDHGGWCCEEGALGDDERMRRECPHWLPVNSKAAAREQMALEVEG